MLVSAGTHRSLVLVKCQAVKQGADDGGNVPIRLIQDASAVTTFEWKATQSGDIFLCVATAEKIIILIYDNSTGQFLEQKVSELLYHFVDLFYHIIGTVI